MELQGFTGTLNYYKSMFGIMKYTDGIKYVADEGKAYWLIDAIESHLMTNKKLRTERMKSLTVVMLEKNDDDSALLSFGDGDGNLIAKQEIPYTDFPEQKIKFYLSNGVLLLPTEW